MTLKKLVKYANPTYKEKKHKKTEQPISEEPTGENIDSLIKTIETLLDNKIDQLKEEILEPIKTDIEEIKKETVKEPEWE